MKNKAFTLAETLITLTILGVVAAITIPSLINKYTESANRTKVKKAMETYEKVLNQMVIDNDIKDSINAWDNNTSGDCTYTSAYFNIAEKESETSNCLFKTKDGVWWDISDIENPILLLNKKYIDPDIDKYEYAKMLENEKGEKLYVYGMVGRIDETTGSLRINDKAYEDSKQQGYYPLYLAKLYSFVNNTEDLTLKYSKPCPNECDIMSYIGGGSSGCSGCSYEFDLEDRHATALFDENGNLYKANYTLPDEVHNGETISYKGVLNGDMSYTLTGYYSSGEKANVFECSQINVNTLNCAGEYCNITYNKDGSIISNDCED